MDERKKSSTQHGMSSRIKKVFVELHDYYYFHGPSEIRKIDKRFIGRKRIIDKLKSILTNTDTRSGAYLITGYRGMGKSSFVSKVIDEIDSSKRISILASSYTRIFALIFLLSLFRLHPESYLSIFLFILAPMTVSAASLWYLAYSDKNKDLLKISQSKAPGLRRGLSFSSRIFKAFILTDEIDAEYAFRRGTQVIFLTFLIHLIVVAITSIWAIDIGYVSRFLLYLLMYSIFWLINYYCMQKHERIRSKKKTTWQIIKHTIKKIKNYFNYSRRIYIKINLGYDELKEIDILRLISRNIEKKYKDFKRLSLRNFLTTSFKIAFIFFFVGVVYYYQPIYNLNIKFKEVIGLEHYFPSQNSTILNQEENNAEHLIASLKTDSTVKKISVYCDSLIYIAYQDVKRIIKEAFEALGLKKFISIDNIHDNFQIPPRNIDYLFFFYFFIVSIIIKYLLPRLLGVASDNMIMRNIKRLNESIEYAVSDEKGGSAGINSNSIFNFFRKKTKTQGKADIREIEKRLIEILELFDHYNRFSIKPEFICIFDELDKIEPYQNVHIKEKEAEVLNPPDHLETTFFATEGVRQRQHTIFKILSNLKHFLNTAKAKFIFIAGREMYDAALADVSDRNFFIGSIFHDVIYVHSFLTDASDGKASDISSMTETYVCQFLFPPYYDVDEYSLKEYRKYLDLFFESEYDSTWNESLKQQKIQKIILTLRSFITFLTYRSNGAPKKITTFFEYYIFKPDIEKKIEDNKLKSDFSLCVGFNPRNLYLELGYYDQYTFGMLTYLVNPVVLSVSKSVKDFGDKLLVSTSFLVDHLYKFHKNAFSWRNIELTPEILDINKAPQLRELIELIIHNLSNSHILEIVSGLYDFKFRKKISEEIAFLSKISEREAAAFNFTLDESLSLKKHHKRLLKEIKANHLNSKENSQFINSLSFISMIIGDLHFYDEEYNEAIIQYMEAVENLRRNEFNAYNSSFFVLLIRNMLKLGYALEKRKSYVSAFMIYGQLVAYIVKFREIDLNSLGLTEKQISLTKLNSLMEKKEKNSRLPFLIEPTQKRLDGKEQVYRESRNDNMIRILVEKGIETSGDKVKLISSNKVFETEINLNYVSEVEIESFDPEKDRPVCLIEDFGKLVTMEPFSRIKEEMVFNISSFEGIRLIFQPLIAKLQMIEKSHLGGIRSGDLKRIECEYNFITKTINYREKHLIAAEFWGKVGDILYFKNGLMPEALFGKTNSEGQTDAAGCFHFYCCSNRPGKSMCSENKKAFDLVSKKGNNIPCRSCEYYMKSLKVLCYDQLKMKREHLEPETTLPHIFLHLKDNIQDSNNATAIKVLANTLAGVGNAIFSCCDKRDNPDHGFLYRYLKFIDDARTNYGPFFLKSGYSGRNKYSVTDFEKEKNDLREFDKVEEVFIFYFLSYFCYVTVGMQKEGFVQILKILYLIRNLIRVEDSTKALVHSLLEKIKDVVVSRGIKCLYRAYGNIHRLEIDDFKNIFNYTLNIDRDDDDVELKEISLNADLRELIIVFEEIRLFCGESEILNQASKVTEYCPVTPYSTVNRMFNRIIDLKFKVTLNYKLFRKLGFYDVLEDLDGNKMSEDLVENRVIELIYKKGMNRILFDSSFNFQNIDDMKEKVFLAIEFLITDSIFCLHEIIKLVGIYGITYMVNYSILANVHKRMAEWCDFFFSYFRNSNGEPKKRIRRDLESLIQPDNMQYIGTRFHYEKAREAYYAIKELHREGKAYKIMNEKMFYLNDDFDDGVYHFNAAAERYRLNTGAIDKEIDAIKKKLEKSTLFEYERYLLNNIKRKNNYSGGI